MLNFHNLHRGSFRMLLHKSARSSGKSTRGFHMDASYSFCICNEQPEAAILEQLQSFTNTKGLDLISREIRAKTVSDANLIFNLLS